MNKDGFYYKEEKKMDLPDSYKIEVPETKLEVNEEQEEVK
jgi:hypothetical protein